MRRAAPVIALAMAFGAVATADEPPPARGYRDVIVAAATANAARPAPERLWSDALADHYLRAGTARLAERLAAGASTTSEVPAFCVGMGVAMDPAGTLVRHPLTGALIGPVEDEAGRAARARVLGNPEIRARGDFCTHFWIAAALRATVGARAAEQAGVRKELADTQSGGSGFSLADLLANAAGIEFAATLLDAGPRLPALVQALATGGHLVHWLPAAEVDEGLDAAAVAARFGGERDPRMAGQLATLRAVVQDARAYHDLRDPLPQGPGLAAKYPDDLGIAGDPDVLLYEDFETDEGLERWSRDSASVSPVASAAVHGVRGMRVSHNGEVAARPHAAAECAYVRAYVRPLTTGCRGRVIMLHSTERGAPPWIAPGYLGLGGSVGLGQLLEGRADSWTLGFGVESHPSAVPRDHGWHTIAGEPSVPLQRGVACIEFMVRANAIRSQDAAAALWVDGCLIARGGGYWRSDASVVLAELRVGSPTATAPFDIDDIVVARRYIGPRIPAGR